MKYCPFCHAQLNDDAAFCGKCGSNQEAFSQNGQPQQTPNLFTSPVAQPVNSYTPVAEPKPQTINQSVALNGLNSQPIKQSTGYGDSDLNSVNNEAPVYRSTADPKPSSDNPAVEAIKRNCRSVLVIVIAVLLSINVISNLLSAFEKFENQNYAATDFVNDKLDDIDDELDDQISETEKKALNYDDYSEYKQVQEYKKSVQRDMRNVKRGVNKYFSTYYSYFSLLNQIGIAVMALIAAIGFWLLYINGTQKTPGMKTGGLSTLNCAATMHMVFYCFFGAAAIVIVTVLQIFSSNVISWCLNQLHTASKTVVGKIALRILNISPGKIENFLTDSRLTTIFIVAYIVLVLTLVLLVFFSARLISSVKKIQRCVKSQTAASKLSVFAAIILFVFGTLSLSGVANIRNAYDVFAVLTSAGYKICIGAWIFKYQSSMAAFSKS